MAFIEIVELWKICYQREGLVECEALKGINLTLERKEFICIAGPSGSGKTTLLNLIGALDSPTSGKIYFEGKDITKIKISQLADFRLHEVGFVFQNYNLINTLSALENVEYVMLLQGTETKLRQEKAKEILERVGLKDFLKRRPHQMSAGQQQRVAVARAIVTQPKLVLADEPTANLDSLTGEKLIDLMKELNREKDISFILASHDEMVMDKADKVFFLKDGRLIN